MKRTLEFADDEGEEFLLAVHASDYYGVLWDLSAWLRSEIKHMNHDACTVQALDCASGKLHELLCERGLDLS